MHGKIRRERSQTNYISYIQKITRHQLSELNELAQNWEDCVNLWSSVLTNSHLTRRRRGSVQLKNQLWQFQGFAIETIFRCLIR